MRAYEFINEEQGRMPTISLRHLDGLGKEESRRAAWHAKREPLVRAMYANPARELEQIELEKARMELEQQKTDLAISKVEIGGEAEAEANEAITAMAEAGSKADQQSRAKITGMARGEMRRRKTDRQSDRRL